MVFIVPSKTGGNTVHEALTRIVIEAEPQDMGSQSETSTTRLK